MKTVYWVVTRPDHLCPSLFRDWQHLRCHYPTAPDWEDIRHTDHDEPVTWLHDTGEGRLHPAGAGLSVRVSAIQAEVAI